MSATTTARDTVCDECGRRRPITFDETVCEVCGGLLEVRYDLSGVDDLVDPKDRGIARWRPLLPVPDGVDLVSLGEGGTPLLSCPTAARWCGLRSLLAKNDSLMPTGSFKDRSMAIAVTLAQTAGDRIAVTFSSGNAAGSLAAYASRAGLRSVAVVQGSANRFKTALMSLGGGARIEVGRTDVSAGEAYCLALDRIDGVRTFMNFLNPFRHEGLKTTAYEIAEDLHWKIPDVVIHPIGTGGGIWAAWKGFEELAALGRTDHSPRMHGVQPESSSFIHEALVAGDASASPSIGRGSTIAQSISAPDVLRGARRPLQAIRQSGGWCYPVTDSEIVAAMRALAADGVLVEPAAAATVAAARRGVDEGRIGVDSRVVCVVTGTALKDPERLHAVADSSPEPSPRDDLERQIARTIAEVAEQLDTAVMLTGPKES